MIYSIRSDMFCAIRVTFRGMWFYTRHRRFWVQRDLSMHLPLLRKTWGRCSLVVSINIVEHKDPDVNSFQ
jgi:hypothetical protein